MQKTFLKKIIKILGPCEIEERGRWMPISNDYMRGLNPNKGSFINWDRKDEKTIKKYDAYLNNFLTKEEKAELLKLEGQYLYKYRQYFNPRTGKLKPEILAKYKLKDFSSKFDWK